MWPEESLCLRLWIGSAPEGACVRVYTHTSRSVRSTRGCYTAEAVYGLLRHGNRCENRAYQLVFFKRQNVNRSERRHPQSSDAVADGADYRTGSYSCRHVCLRKRFESCALRRTTRRRTRRAWLTRTRVVTTADVSSPCPIGSAPRPLMSCRLAASMRRRRRAAPASLIWQSYSSQSRHRRRDRPAPATQFQPESARLRRHAGRPVGPVVAVAVAVGVVHARVSRRTTARPCRRCKTRRPYRRITRQ